MAATDSALSLLRARADADADNAHTCVASLPFSLSSSSSAAASSLVVATALGNLTPVVSALLGAALGRERLTATKARAHTRTHTRKRANAHICCSRALLTPSSLSLSLLPRHQLLGIALALGGSVLMANPSTPFAPHPSAPPSPLGVPRATFLRGAALLAASPCAWATSLYLQKPLLTRHPPVSLTAWTFLIGTTAMGTLAAGLYRHQPDAWRLAGAREGGALAAAVLFGWCVSEMTRAHTFSHFAVLRLSLF